MGSDCMYDASKLRISIRFALSIRNELGLPNILNLSGSQTGRQQFRASPPIIFAVPF